VVVSGGVDEETLRAAGLIRQHGPVLQFKCNALSFFPSAGHTQKLCASFFVSADAVQRNILYPVLSAAAKRRGKAAGVKGVSRT